MDKNRTRWMVVGLESRLIFSIHDQKAEAEQAARQAATMAMLGGEPEDAGTYAVARVTHTVVRTQELVGSELTVSFDLQELATRPQAGEEG